MRHILILTHGEFCRGIRDSLRLILGERRDIRCVALEGGDDVEQVRAGLQEVIGAGAAGDEYLLLTDLFGGTTNIAVRLLEHNPGLHVVSGLNLNLLLEAATAPESDPIEEVIQRGIDASVKGIRYVNRLFCTSEEE